MILFVDLIIIVIFIINISNHYKKGLIRSLYNIILFILGTVLTKLIQPFIKTVLINSSILNKVTPIFFRKN